ncbi:MAG TPA: tRNA (adenosine(37)-N6)-threonylcarbamoyltransferase complex ATPase subunit type 1 TsaE [Chthoniobacterales bacterium]|nr:tRNA (adenosine(37)-N6)-threonylcarbamoyltransferase complex ATPase subunit type 1 TsaE [Chthoniobacterales bacterium]
MIASNSVAQTIALGRTYGEQARRGDVFALRGDLGAGKTQFVKGFIAGLGSKADATSPTFVLVHEYGDGRLPAYHFDFCRLESPEALSRMGFDDYIFGDGVSLIEWADKFAELIPPGARWISFEAKSETERLITVS